MIFDNTRIEEGRMGSKCTLVMYICCTNPLLGEGLSEPVAKSHCRVLIKALGNRTIVIPLETNNSHHARVLSQS